MKRILVILAIYSLIIMLFTIFSLSQSLGARIMVSPQMFLVNFLILLPIIIFSVLVLIYLRRK